MICDIKKTSKILANRTQMDDLSVDKNLYFT